jgi:hypothetical protein
VKVNSQRPKNLPAVLIVKFVTSYSETIHQHCAQNHLAPQLFEVQELAGGWKMVVMAELPPEATAQA